MLEWAIREGLRFRCTKVSEHDGEVPTLPVTYLMVADSVSMLRLRLATYRGRPTSENFSAMCIDALDPPNASACVRQIGAETISWSAR